MLWNPAVAAKQSTIRIRTDDRNRLVFVQIERRQSAFIFQQRDDLACRLAGKLAMLRATDNPLRHARIHVSGEEATLEDLGSRNGTLLKGRRIHALSPLADGDEIRVGSARLLFEGR